MASIGAKHRLTSKSASTGLKTRLKTMWGFTAQKQMFDWLWASRPRVCPYTGNDLSKVPLSQYHWMFAHVLPKGLYPLWKLNPENIEVVWPAFHVCVDNFTSDMYVKYPNWKFSAWFEKQEKYKEIYKQFLKDNL